MDHLNRQERVGAGLAAGSVLLVGGSVAASSLLGGYPVLGGQGIRYLVAGLVLAAWARLRRTPLPRPSGREWAWLAGLAVIGLAGCSVLLIEATRVTDPATVGVVIGAAPLVIVIAAAVAAGNRPARRVLLAAAVVTAGSVAAQLGGATGLTWSGPGLLLSAGALGGAAGISLLAAPVLPRLGALAVTIYACGLAGILLLAAAAVARSAGGPPILRTPTVTQLAALSYLAVAVTAVVCLAWYAAMKRLGVDRTGLFNGLIPIASLAAVALTGTGTITTLQCLAALTVLAGVILGLGRAANSGHGEPAAEPGPGGGSDGVQHHTSVDQRIFGLQQVGKTVELLEPGIGVMLAVRGVTWDLNDDGVLHHVLAVVRAERYPGNAGTEEGTSCLVLTPARKFPLGKEAFVLRGLLGADVNDDDVKFAHDTIIGWPCHVRVSHAAARRSSTVRSGIFLVSAAARRNSSAASLSRPSRASRSPRTLGRWWYPASAGSAASPSTISSPREGPNAMASATARFNSTTGDGAKARSAWYSSAICSQSVSAASPARA